MSEADLSGEVEVVDIREAYPLMDAVARQEGWDDPEMDSYNVYVPKPKYGRTDERLTSMNLRLELARNQTRRQFLQNTGIGAIALRGVAPARRPALRPLTIP